MARNTAEIAAVLRVAERIAIVTHVNPDGDAIGSALALALALKRLGKQASVFNQDKVPDNLYLLKGVDEIRKPESLLPEERFDLLLSVDVSDVNRMGKCSELLSRCAHTAQIDHHGTNPLFCEHNAVDPHAPAAGLLVREVLKLLNVSLDVEISKCLYAAISTDTGNFAFSNTTAEAFEVAGELMNAGLPLSEMNRVLFLERKAAQVLLLQRALATLTFYCNGKVSSMMLTQKDFEECGALSEHADTIVNQGSSIIGVQMTVLARETDKGIKMSLRALAPNTVDQIAASFGGGGHTQASGCTMQGSLADCTAQVVAKMCASLEQAD